MKSYRKRESERALTGTYIVKDKDDALRDGQEEDRLPHVVVVDHHQHRHL